MRTRDLGGFERGTDAGQRVMEERRFEDRFSGESQGWVAALRGPTAIREEATAQLHALLLRGARFELSRVRHAHYHASSEALDRVAIQAADAALGTVVASLDSFRGTSRFTTWASKFVLREARVRLRPRAWRGRGAGLDVQGPAAESDTEPASPPVADEDMTVRALRDRGRSARPTGRGAA